VVTVCEAIVGDLATTEVDLEARRSDMERALEADGLVAFSEVHIVERFEAGIVDVAQANGYAGMQSNTVMFGWPGGADGLTRTLRIVGAMSRIKRNTILAKLPFEAGPAEHRKIDVWWRGMQYNGDLMLLLAYLLNLNPEWRRARIAIRTIVDSEDEVAPMTEKLHAMVSEARIQAEAHVMVRPTGRAVPELLQEASADADVVFLGLQEPRPGEEAEAAERLNALVEGFDTAILVRSAGPFAGQLL